MDKKTALKQLRLFKKKTSVYYPLQKVILFGSYVQGKMHKDSDIDLILVSPAFKKLDFFQRGARMYDYWDIDTPVDFLCYTPEEFAAKKRQLTIVRQAVQEGIEI